MDAAHLRRPRYVATLSVIASLILIVGWLVRPRAIPQSPPAVQSEIELDQLARRAERRSLEGMSTYFARIARDVNPFLVYIPAANTTGIAWDETHIVAGPLAPAAQAGPITVKAPAAGFEAAPAISGPNLPLAVLEVPGDVRRLNVARRATALPEAGQWIVALWRSDDAPAFAATNVRQSAPTTCGLAPAREVVSNLSLTRVMLGGGLFNIDGELLAVILPCDDHIAAIHTSSVAELLTRADTLEQRLLARYGVVFGRLSEDERRYFQDGDGLLVREVWNGSVGDAAGLWPGDLVTSVNGQRLARIEDLQAAAVSPATPIQLGAARGTRTVTLTLGADATPAAVVAEQRDVGLIMAPSSATYRIDAVVPDSRAARAGLRPGDRLVRIDRMAPRSAEQVRRILRARAAAPMLLEVARDARRIAIVLP
jgi:S1-C subfamily serine protease